MRYNFNCLIFELQLTRLSREQLFRRCKRLVREQTYKEIIQRDEANAVRFLQNELSDTFDHNDSEEIKAVSFT